MSRSVYIDGMNKPCDYLTVMDEDEVKKSFVLGYDNLHNIEIRRRVYS